MHNARLNVYAQRETCRYVKQHLFYQYEGIARISRDGKVLSEIGAADEHLYTQVRKVGHHPEARMFAPLCLEPAPLSTRLIAASRKPQAN